MPFLYIYVYFCQHPCRVCQCMSFCQQLCKVCHSYYFNFQQPCRLCHFYVCLSSSPAKCAFCIMFVFRKALHSMSYRLHIFLFFFPSSPAVRILYISYVHFYQQLFIVCHLYTHSFLPTALQSVSFVYLCCQQLCRAIKFYTFGFCQHPCRFCHFCAYVLITSLQICHIYI